MVLVVIAAVYVGLFAYYLHATIIRQPYWDMYSYIVRYLQYRDDGGVWAYLWEPHVQHRHVWMRLLTAVDIEAFAGVSYPFILAAAACQATTAWLLWRAVRMSAPHDGQRTLQCFVVLLVMTAVAAVDCAIPMNGIYPQAVMFSVLAFVLFDVDPARHSLSAVHWRRGGGLAAAMAAAFANAAALAVWPILVWMAWRSRAGRIWTASVAITGSLFVPLYLNGLPIAAQSDAAAGLTESSNVLSMADYLITYMGLPWTRAAALAVPGRALGAILLSASAALVLWRGLIRPGGRFERLGVALILFSLASAILATLGRSGMDADARVAVRYSVFVAPMHVGLLFLAWPSIVRQWALPQRRRLVEGAAVVVGLALLAQQVASGQAAVATTRAMRSTLDRFAAGEESPDMTTVVFVNLAQARRDHDIIRGAGLYLDAR